MEEVIFINKTGSSGSLSKSSHAEAATVLSHVQRNRRKAEGRNHNKPWLNMSSVLHPMDTSRSEKRSEHTATVSLVIVDPHEPLSSPSHMPKTYPSANGYDPFHCTIIGSDAETHALLLRTFFNVARGNFIAEAFAPNPDKQSKRMQEATSRHATIITKRIQRCVDDKLLMYATLAYSSSMLGWTTGRFRHKKPPEFFIAKALPDLRFRLGQKIGLADDWLLMSLYSLAITEFWNGLPVIWSRHPGRNDMILRTAAESLEASRTHLKALIYLVTNVGGWHLVDPYILDSTILADKYLAIATMEPPMLSAMWDPGPLKDDIRAELNITELAYPFLGKQLLEEPLSTRLIEILKDLVAHCRVAHDIWSLSDAVTAELESWLFRRFQAIQYRLIFQYHDGASTYLDRCISLAALVFACGSTPSHGPQLGARYLAKALRGVLEEDTTAWKYLSSENLRLWCIYVGSVAPGPPEDKSWFQGQLKLHVSQRATTVDPLSFIEEYLLLPIR